MRMTIATVLALWLMVTGMTTISCSSKEKSASKAGETALPQPPSNSQAPKAPLKPQTTDALSGKPIDRAIYSDYDGYRIYFCCTNSRKTFENFPVRYLKAFREQGVQLEQTPKSN